MWSAVSFLKRNQREQFPDQHLFHETFMAIDSIEEGETLWAYNPVY